MTISFGSAQTGGMPVRVTAVTQATAQLLHTAPVGAATPDLVKVLVNNLTSVSQRVTIVIDDGVTERLIAEDVPVRPGLFPILSGRSVPLNQANTVSIFASNADAIEAYAEVDDQTTATGAGGLASQQVFMGHVDMTGVTSASRYRANGLVASATEANHQIKMSRAGVLRNLRAAAGTAVNGAADVDVTVRVNGAGTALTLNFVNGDGTTDKTDTDSVQVAAGDLVTFQVTETAGVDPQAVFEASVEFADS